MVLKTPNLHGTKLLRSQMGSVDKCARTLQQIANILQDLGVYKQYTVCPIIIHNNNATCVQWAHNMSTKGMRFIQICKNAVREQVQNNFIDVHQDQGYTLLICKYLNGET